MLRVFEFGRPACEAVVMLDVQIPVEIDVDLEDFEVQQSLLLLGCRVLAASYVSVDEDEDCVFLLVLLVRTRIRALDSSMWGAPAEDAVTMMRRKECVQDWIVRSFGCEHVASIS